MGAGLLWPLVAAQLEHYALARPTHCFALAALGGHFQAAFVREVNAFPKFSLNDQKPKQIRREQDGKTAKAVAESPLPRESASKIRLGRGEGVVSVDGRALARVLPVAPA